MVIIPRKFNLLQLDDESKRVIIKDVCVIFDEMGTIYKDVRFCSLKRNIW